jgi:hypothetical protein
MASETPKHQAIRQLIEAVLKRPQMATMVTGDLLMAKRTNWTA